MPAPGVPQEAQGTEAAVVMAAHRPAGRDGEPASRLLRKTIDAWTGARCMPGWIAGEETTIYGVNEFVKLGRLKISSRARS